MPGGVTYGLQEVTEIGASTDQDLTLSGSNTFDGALNLFDDGIANSPNLRVNDANSAGNAKAFQYYQDNVEQMYFGAAFTLPGLIQPSAAGVIFFAIASASQGFLLNGAAQPAMWGGGSTGFLVGGAFGLYSAQFGNFKADALAPWNMNGNPLNLDTDLDSFIYAAVDDQIQFATSATDRMIINNTDTRTVHGRRLARAAYSSTSNIAVTDDYVGADSSGGAITLTLQSVAALSGKRYIIKDEGGSAASNNITIATQGSETIDGASTFVINTSYMSKTVISDGSDWFLI